jgi:hypothetical protein
MKRRIEKPTECVPLRRDLVENIVVHPITDELLVYFVCGCTRFYKSPGMQTFLRWGKCELAKQRGYAARKHRIDVILAGVQARGEARRKREKARKTD